MNRIFVALLTTAALSVPAAAQNQPKDPIGLTATQRQMTAWSIAGVAHNLHVPYAAIDCEGPAISANQRRLLETIAVQAKRHRREKNGVGDSQQHATPAMASF